MPRLNGSQLLVAIKADERLAELPVILLSANLHTQGERDAYFDRGAAMCLSKDLPAEIILSHARAFMPGPSAELAR